MRAADIRGPLQLGAGPGGDSTATNYVSEGLADNYSVLAEDTGLKKAEREASYLLSMAEGHLMDGDGDAALDAAEQCLDKLKGFSGSSTYETDALRFAVQARCFRGERKAALLMAEEELERFQDKGDKRGQASMLLAAAEATYEALGGNLDEALQAATESRKLSKELEDARLECAALLCQADIHIKQAMNRGGNFKKTLQLGRTASETALDVARAAKDKRMQGKSLRVLSAVLFQLREFSTAMKSSEKALAMFKQCNDRRSEALEMVSQAQWHLSQDEPRQAVEVATKALEIFWEAAPGKGMRQVAALEALVDGYIANGEASEAVDVAEEGVDQIRELDEKKGEADAWYTLFRAYFANGDLKEAFDAAERSQILYIRKKNEKQEAGLYVACTYLFFQRDYPGKSLQASQMASKIYQRIGSPEEQARCQQRLAEVHLERGEFGEAMLAAESARELCESCGDRRFEAVVHMTMSGINYNAEQDNFEAALEPAERAQSIARELEDTRAEASTLQAIARMQIEQQDYKAALENARKARVCFQDLGDKRAVCEILITIAQTELISELNEAKENDNKFKGEPGEKGLKLAKEALELSRRLRDGLLTVSALHSVAEVHIAVGRLDEAAKVIDEAMALCQESEYELEEGRVCNLAAYMHLYAQRKDESTEMANKSLEISTKLEDAEGQAAAQEIMAKIQATFRKAEVVMAPVGGDDTPGEAAPAAADSLAVAEPMEYNGPSLDVLSHKLQSMVRDMFDVEDIENDTMLMDVGIDSLSMLDFHAKVARDFPGVAWSPTMLFDYPTLKELCEFMDEAMQEAFNARLAKSLKGK